MDTKPVNVIATDCSTQISSVERTEKDVRCPQLVVDNDKGMGGVDVHDQLRLQRYSIQKSILMHCRHGVVNGYIVHRTPLAKKEKLHLHMQIIMTLAQPVAGASNHKL
ncbi:hypothetical protein PHMEG_00019522 [Phytophthora megakarya]|uniref:Uncharacterized protein n=1 Tax=Phytophthora megakarya TaxID=4795 RepID=A0A225VR44_9STRA|nr:hypothetical protein PHMEG_00019522 [Phytophthora megakarya]